MELTPVSKNAIEGATLVRYLAVIYAWAGDKDRAIQRLAETTYLPGSHIPIVEQGRPVAILSVRDIVNFLADLFPEGILNLPPNPGSIIHRTVDGG